MKRKNQSSRAYVPFDALPSVEMYFEHSDSAAIRLLCGLQHPLKLIRRASERDLFAHFGIFERILRESDGEIHDTVL